MIPGGHINKIKNARMHIEAHFFKQSLLERYTAILENI